jgi:DNA-binding transcriptional LysR family regulator
MRHLAAFAAIAEETSFRGTACRLNYAQPTVSHQMATLERLLGIELINRGSTPRSARPTPAGAVLLHYIEQIAETVADAEAALQHLRRDGAT